VRPYVIVAPGYTEKSWGVRTQHLLCHLLNQMGVPAYMHLLRRSDTNPAWRTPIATRRHVDEGIVVYGELEANPLHARRVVRWILNRPGYINGTVVPFGPDDYVMAFSPMMDATKPILNLQTPNEGVFHPHDLPEKHGELFYVGKGLASARREDIERGRTEITRAWPATHPDLADLLRRSAVVYSYDTLTGINYEATWCGTLAVIIPNGPYTREDIARGELGLNGIAWGTDPVEIARAVRTLPDAYPQYLKVLERQHEGVAAFVAATQQRW
jgi:hypothetical protein